MSTYTSSLGLELITPGSQAGLWGNTTNNTFTLIDQAVTGVTPISFASASGTTYMLTDYNGAADEARSAVLNITGSAIGANTVIVPNKQKTYLVRNNTGQDVVFQTAIPTATYTVGAGYSILIFCDGNNNVFTGIASPSVGTLSVAGGGTGTTTFLSGGFIKSAGSTSALTASQYVALGSEVSGTLPVSNGGTGVTSITANNLVVGAGTSAVTFIAPGTAGQVLTSNGTVWQAATPSAGVTSVSASLPLSSSGGTTPNISITGQVGVANGGTGVATFAAGFVKSPGLTSNLTTVTSIDLSTSDVSGTLTVGRGGTGAASLTSSALLVGNGTGSITSISPGANGTVLTSNGSAWSAASLPAFVTGVNAGTGISVVGTTNPTIANTGVLSISSTTIGVSPASGNVVITLSGANVTGALGYTPLNASTGVAYDSSRLGGALASSYLTSSSGTAYDSARLGGTLASSYLTSTTGVTLSGSQTIGGAKTFSTGITVSGNVLASAFNFASTSSWYLSGTTIVGATNNSTVIQCASGGTYNPTGVYGTISDVSQKENIEPARNYLNDINKVNVVKYSLKEENSSVPTKLGVIAQEVEQIFPGLIYDAEDGIKNVKMSLFIPMLVKSVQELTAKLEAAEARIAALEAK